MIEPIINQIALGLDIDLNWADVITGVCEVLRLKMGADGTVEKVIPGYLNTNPSTCNTSRYLDLVPNSGKKSIIYFDNLSESVESENRYYKQMNASLRLVCWVNLPLIDKSLTNAITLQQDVLKNLPVRVANQSPFAWNRVSVLGVERNESIFSAWSYDEAEKQYLIFPFDYFAINLSINYRYLTNCPLPINEDPDLCLKQ
jgi:hypothetical protein